MAPSDAELRRLQPLLQAHEAELASQKLCMDTAGLMQTFELLLRLVRELQGICARRVDLTQDDEKPLFPDMYATEGIQTPKEQVRELHLQSTHLQELQECINDFGRLETLT